ncbi:MAG: hypothetical protein ACYCSW_08460 [bacterium]
MKIKIPAKSFLRKQENSKDRNACRFCSLCYKPRAKRSSVMKISIA